MKRLSRLLFVAAVAGLAVPQTEVAASACSTGATGQVTAWANCKVQTSPIIVNTFFGAQRNGVANEAYDAWDADIGEPVRKINFDDATFTGPSVALSAFSNSTQGTVTQNLDPTAGGAINAVGFKTGGDLGLFPLLKDPDNLIIKQAGTTFKGVTNVDNLDEPNINLLAPGANNMVEFNFGEGLKVDAGTIKNFGAVEAVGAYLSTLNAVTLEVFDVSGASIYSFTKTPGSLDPFFMGIVLPRREQPKQEIIATARFTFAGASASNALDGLVFTTVVDIDTVPNAPPVPEPGTLALLALGLAALRVRGRRLA